MPSGKEPVNRTVKLNFWVTPEEEKKIRERMAHLGITNISAYFRKANAIGYELAMRFTKGRNAFIVATHIDKQTYNG